MEKLLGLLKFIGFAVICIPLSSIIHELGHVVCGLLHKWKLALLSVGPLKLYRDEPDSKLRAGLEKNPILWFGRGGTFPPDDSERSVKIWGRILLAGPLTSITAGILLLALCIAVSNESLFLILLAGISVSMGICCLLPIPQLRTGFLYNDGTRYKRLRSGNASGSEERALFMLTAREIRKLPVSETPAEILKPLLGSKEPEMNYYGYYYSYLIARENKNEAEMAAQRRNMESIRDKVMKTVVDACKV